MLRVLSPGGRPWTDDGPEGRRTRATVAVRRPGLRVAHARESCWIYLLGRFLAEGALGRLEGDLGHLADGGADGLRVGARQPEPVGRGGQTLLVEPPAQQLLVGHLLVPLGEHAGGEPLDPHLPVRGAQLRLGDEVEDDVADELLAEAPRVDVTDEGGDLGEAAAVLDLAHQGAQLGGRGLGRVVEPVGEHRADDVDRAGHVRVLPLQQLGHEGGELLLHPVPEGGVVDQREHAPHVVVREAVLGHHVAAAVDPNGLAVAAGVGDLPDVTDGLVPEADDVPEPRERVDHTAVQGRARHQDGDALVQGGQERLGQLVVSLADGVHVALGGQGVVDDHAHDRHRRVVDVLGLHRGSGVAQDGEEARGAVDRRRQLGGQRLAEDGGRVDRGGRVGAAGGGLLVAVLAAERVLAHVGSPYARVLIWLMVLVL